MLAIRRFINAFVLIIFILSLSVVFGCGDSEKDAKINELNNRISDLKSQQQQLNQEINAAKEKQGWFRNHILSDTEEVKNLKDKIKNVESEIAATEKELATLTGNGNDNGFQYKILDWLGTFGEVIANKFSQ